MYSHKSWDLRVGLWFGIFTSLSNRLFDTSRGWTRPVATSTFIRVVFRFERKIRQKPGFESPGRRIFSSEAQIAGSSLGAFLASCALGAGAVAISLEGEF